MVSCVMVSAELPIFYYAYKNRWDRKQFWKRFAVCALGAFGAFGVALVVNAAQQAFYHGSLQSAFNNILYTISKRTGLFNIEIDAGYRKSLEAGKWSVIKTYMLGGPTLIGGYI